MLQQPIFSQTDLITAFNELTVSTEHFWASFSPEVFIERPLDRSWSPAQNVLHLYKSTKPVVLALHMPRFILRLLFGVSKAPSRHYDKVKELYEQILAGGAQASGKYVPKLSKKAVDLVDYQKKQISRLTETISSLANALEKWSEQELDHYQAPHPLLGKLTMRELLFFSLFHHQHHISMVTTKCAAIPQDE